jgi:pimeloyl-ACP methyl ester carboxylesterase
MSSEFQLKTKAGTFGVIDYGGSGPDCLLIHGTGQNAAAWDGVARRLASGVRAVAFDMRGHGQTPEVSKDPEQYWRDIGPVADALGMRSPILVGHSTGAYAATAYAAAGGNVTRIICVDGFTLDMPANGSRGTRSAPDAQVLFDMFRYGWLASSAERATYIDEVIGAAPNDWLNAEVEPGLLRQMLERCFAKTPSGWLRRPSLDEIAVVSDAPAGPIAPCLSVYEGIKVPLLFIWARRGLSADRYAELKALADAAPNRRLVSIDSSHNVPLQRPGELAALILKEVEMANSSQAAASTFRG